MSGKVIICGFVIAIGLLIWAAIAVSIAAQKEDARMYAECIADGESKWTCQTMVEAREAQRAAAFAAGAAVGAAMSAGARK